jgi:hypothetical protein
MSSQHSEVRTAIVLVTAALGLGLAGCTFDENPAGVSGNEAAIAASASESATLFGPFPGGTTIFVDVDNVTGVETGTREHPFNTLSEGIAAARGGDAIGLAPGVYAETFGSLRPNYVIEGLSDFRLLGMGPARTTIRGDHSFSLIRVQNGASGLISGFTIEHGGHSNHSEGGGIQVLGRAGPVSLTVKNVVLQDNEAVNGAAISAYGDVTLRLINVVAANNRASNCCGGVYLLGVNARLRARLTNTTITANTASFQAGGVFAQAASLNLVNSIVWNNSLAELGTRDVSLSVSYSDIGERLFPGPGNISAFPRFHDPANRDYRLRPSSPAVDAGTNTGAPSTDIRGLRRPVDGDGDGVAITDMGAYEFGKTASTSP